MSDQDLPAGYAEGSYWYYAPNKVAPIVFAAFFLISAIVHAYQCSRYRCWKVGFPLPWAGLLFVGAFIAREIGAYDYDNLGVFIASTVMFLVAAPVYEGANYFLLGRILYYVPYNSPIHPGRVVTTFLGVDLIIAVVTGVGAPRVANSSASQSEQDVGKALLKAGLILQLASMFCFVLIAAYFQRKCARTGTLSHNLQKVLTILYISCGLITVRTIYRTVEYFEAASLNVYADVLNISPLLKQEWFFWVFEASVMFLNTLLLNIWHPSRFLPRNNKIYLKQDGVTEVEGPGYHDKRPFLLTLFDPFDVVGIIIGRDKKNRFWEEGSEELKPTNAV
ncbi:hypothetical protein CYLTODRAFT_386713 [Cylindrobasidium torrendii FP15055 ss-10]|uniref:RTA1-domain-containing protein n=1 Tax=Cylindrobasidium torrendii FP15055 ss-10 TaxID=1314674 RepID=A0A0D7BTG6_9AGAR|nr:hypothetical protein CYLTODRAFT_386713 [Cylindrobasidium torrendii FP15055 ss-10]